MGYLYAHSGLIRLAVFFLPHIQALERAMMKKRTVKLQ